MPLTDEQKTFMNRMLLTLNAIGFVYTIYIIIISSFKSIDKVSKSLIYMTMIHVFCYSIRFGTFFASLMITNKNAKSSMTIISNGFWVLAVVLFYVILVVRLHLVFKGSVYKLTKYHITIYIILIGIIAPLWGLACMMKMYKYIPIFIIVIINLYIGISVSMIFSRNIIKLVVATTPKPVGESRTLISFRDADSNISSESEPQIVRMDTELNKQQNSLMKTVTKTGVLAIFALIFYQILLIFWGTVNVLVQHYSGYNSIGFICKVIANVLIFISIWMEIHCVYLGFNYNDKEYHRLCCLCHNYAHKRVQTVTHQQINSVEF